MNMENIGNEMSPYKAFELVSLVPEWLESRPDVSWEAKGLYARLCRYMGAGKLCCPSQETLAKALGMSIRTIQRAIKVLKDLGLIKVKGGFHKANSIAFLVHKWMFPQQAQARQIGGPRPANLADIKESVEKNQTEYKRIPSVTVEANRGIRTTTLNTSSSVSLNKYKNYKEAEAEPPPAPSRPQPVLTQAEMERRDYYAAKGRAMRLGLVKPPEEGLSW